METMRLKQNQSEDKDVYYLSVCYGNLANALCDMQREEEAVGYFNEAIKLLERQEEKNES